VPTKLRNLSRYWKPILGFTFIPVLAAWLAEESRDWYQHLRGWKPDHQGEPLLTIPLLIVALLIISCLAAAATRDLFRPRNIALGPKSEPDPHPHLILFLSNLSPYGKFVEGVPLGLELVGQLDADLDEMERRKDKEKLKPGEAEIRWAWEMPLRGLQQHRPALQTVTLVCSEQSLPQAHLFARVISRYKNEFHKLSQDGIRLLVRSGTSVALIPCPVEAAPAGDPKILAWNFEDYDELFKGLVLMMDRLAQEGHRETDMIVDVTSGQKPNSIVGALLTVNRRAKFQYVQTNDPCKVISYDLMTNPTVS
jgi:hypothetical protein